MAVVAGSAVWFGGIWLLIVLGLAAGGMVWECARLGGAEAGRTRDVLMPLLTITLFVLVALGGSGLIFALPVVAGWSVLVSATRLRLVVGVYAAASVLAALLLMVMRASFGIEVLLWLIIVVIASDVMGYFAGRILGGPKFWPAISPKKTWSGTVAGWIGAALVGWLASDVLMNSVKPEWPLSPVIFSVLLAFAAQMGDIAESFIKRRAGIKDSSNLIPGHGGLLDRLDGMIGAALMFFVVWYLV
nr:CDP-archaeol synthase [Lentibacter algarum]